MCPVPNGVDNQRLHALQPVECLFGDEIGIGDIGHAAYPVAKYWQLVVHQRQRQDVRAVYDKLVAIERMQIKFGDAGIVVVAKAIGDASFQSIEYLWLGIDVERLVQAIRAQVSPSAHMVEMLVGKQDGTDF